MELRATEPRATYERISRERGECDCGADKPRKAIACARCTWLDGQRGTAELISLLREMGTANMKQLEHETGRDQASIWRSLRALRISGRVTQREIEHERGTDEVVYCLTAG